MPLLSSCLCDITGLDSGCLVVEDDSPGNRIGQHAFKHISRQQRDVIRTSLLDAVEHDLNVGSCEFFEFQLPDDGNDVLLDNASDVARIAVTFFNDIGQPAFGECFDCRWVFLFKLFFLLFLRGIDAMDNH